MDGTIRGRLGAAGPVFRWLLEPTGEVTEAGRAFLLGQLLAGPAAAIMGSFSAISVALAALLRGGGGVYGLFVAIEIALIAARIVDWRRREARLRREPAFVPTIDASVLLSVLWCGLQGALAFTIMSGDDPVMRVLSATLIMALVGPICSRNYAAPRYACLLVALCDLPFVLGALNSGEPWLFVIALMTPPFFFAAMRIITTFHRAMLVTLAAEARNRHLAHHDSLTGILNRQGMDEALGRIVPHEDRQMALICIDLDGFKQVNDRYGHGAGDLLLVQVAKRIGEALGGADLLARIGGDEFMVVVRDIAPAAVGSVVERLIAAISNHAYELGERTIARVGASIGFACLPEDAGNTVELRLRADQALYVAKGAGKGVGRRYRAPGDAADTRPPLPADASTPRAAAQPRRAVA